MYNKKCIRCPSKILKGLYCSLFFIILYIKKSHHLLITEYSLNYKSVLSLWRDVLSTVNPPMPLFSVRLVLVCKSAHACSWCFLYSSSSGAPGSRSTALSSVLQTPEAPRTLSRWWAASCESTLLWLHTWALFQLPSLLSNVIILWQNKYKETSNGCHSWHKSSSMFCLVFDSLNSKMKTNVIVRLRFYLCCRLIKVQLMLNLNYAAWKRWVRLTSVWCWTWNEPTLMSKSFYPSDLQWWYISI